MNLTAKNNKGKIKYGMKRWLAIALCIANLCSFAFIFAPIQASAADTATGSPMLLHCSTGSVAGDRVLYFTVRYKDTSGNSHSQVIYPNEAKKLTNKKVEASTDAALSYDAYTTALESITPFYSLAAPSNTALQANSEDYLYFETAYTFGSLQYIDFYVHYDTVTSVSKNEWQCVGLELIQLKDLSGFSFVGAVSQQIIPNFTGVIIARKENSTDYTWATAKEDHLFHLSFSSKSKDTSLVEPNSNKKNYTTSDDRYFLELDVADAAGAGLETLIHTVGRTRLTGKTVREQLLLTLSYTNIFGSTSTVKIPLVTAFLTQIKMQTSETVLSLAEIDGIFRQGDTVGLTCTLPFIQTDGMPDISFKITYGSEKDLCSGVYTEEISTGSVGSNSFVKPNDDFRISALRLYKAQEKTMSYTFANGCVQDVLNLTDDPKWAYVSQSVSGLLISNGSSKGDTLEGYLGGITKPVVKDMYLVSITTDSVPDAGTNQSISFSLKYAKKSGVVLSSDTVKLNDLANTYYGYWQSNGKAQNEGSASKTYQENMIPKQDFAYLYNVSPGHTLSFFMQISDVRSFSGASFSITGDDDWQAQSIEIFKVSDMGHRNIEWTSTTEIEDEIYPNYMYASGSKAKFSSDRIITRVFDTDPTLCMKYDNPILVRSDSAKTVEFESGNVINEGDSDDVDFSHDTQYLSFEETKQNFGFTKERATYEVAVQVGNEVNTNSTDGDCGSKNKFYFQLIFTEGKSAYVLANQQLSSDGFRTGTEEKFRIYTNRDYGELKSIHIIPEDPDSDDDVFDKLKISNIRVSKVNNEGVALEWNVYINDWISIEYSDSGADTGYEGEQGKTEAQLARTYSVTSSGYAANMMVAISTASVDVGTEQLSGNVSGEIWYIDNSGVERCEPISDITKLMYDYIDKDVSNYMTVDGKQKAMVNQSIMGRPGHKDRFFVNISNVRTIEYMYLTVNSTQKVNWQISNISVFLVEGSGQVVYNSMGDYENTGKCSLICFSSDNDNLDNSNVKIELTDQGTKKSGKITMSENEITVQQQKTGYTTNISKEPEGKDDSINVFVFMNGDASDVSGYDMICAATYNTVSSQNLKKSVNLNCDTEHKVFYKIGVSTSGLVDVSKLYLAAEGNGNAKATVSYAVVEHVRSGVLISTSYYYYYGKNATTTLVSEDYAQPLTNTQYLTFELTEESSSIPLVEKLDDIAVSITYTTMVGKYVHTVTSVNNFLSESNVAYMQPGHVYSVKLEQDNVTSIKSVNFVAMGNAIDKVGIKYAYVSEYPENGGDCIAWYSFAKGLTSVSSTARSMTLTNVSGSETGNTVGQVQMSIKTAASDSVVESSTSAPIKMTLGYYDQYNKIHYTTYRDIRTYATSGSTYAGETLELAFMVPNIQSVRTVELMPTAYTVGEDTTWKVESISVRTLAQGSERNVSRYANGVASEGTSLTVNMSDVELSVAAYSYNPSNKSSFNQTFSSKTTQTEGMQITADRTVTFTPTVSGSSMGANCKCYKVINGADVLCDSAIVITGKGNEAKSVLFSPIDASTPDGLYKIVFTSNEFSMYQATVYVTVEATTFIAVKAVVNNSAGESTSTSRIVGTSSENKTVKITTAETVNLTPGVYYSTKGTTFKCYKVENGVDKAVDGVVTLIASGTANERIVFNANYLSDPVGEYKVVFTAEESSGVTATVPISVQKVTDSATLTKTQSTTKKS